MRCLLALALATFLVSGCQPLIKLVDCSTQQCLMMLQQANPSRDLDFWSAAMQKPVLERIGGMPPELLEYIQLDNRLNGFPVDVSAQDDAETTKLLLQAYQSLPASVTALMDKRLAGVFVVRNLGTSGFTESILDREGNPVAAVVLLDADLFKRSGNEWASWRDSTPFIADPRYQIKTRIADEDKDSIMVAAQFLLIHELGHVYSVGSDLHPDWYQDLSLIDLTNFPFTRISWTIARPSNRYRSRFDNIFWQRRQLAFYREPQLPAREMLSTVENLGASNFVSLYGSTSPLEDFAESFAVYVHTELMQQPYRLEVIVDGVVASQFATCLRDSCLKKMEIMRQIFEP